MLSAGTLLLNGVAYLLACSDHDVHVCVWSHSDAGSHSVPLDIFNSKCFDCSDNSVLSATTIRLSFEFLKVYHAVT